MKFKILVVDDEREIVEMIVRFLRSEGYDAGGATDPIEALESLRRGNYKIAILDIVMPKMTGIELLKEIKRRDGIIRVLMLTAHVSIENIIACLENGADDCLFKPLQDMALLRQAVDREIEKLGRWHKVIMALGSSRPAP